MKFKWLKILGGLFTILGVVGSYLTGLDRGNEQADLIKREVKKEVENHFKNQ